MQSWLKIHLIIPERDKKLLSQLSKYCQITGWHPTWEQAFTWAHELKGASPDLVLICQQEPFLAPRELEQLDHFRKKLGSQIVFLLSRRFLANEALIAALIKRCFYDFWFMDDFTPVAIKEVLFTRRTLAAAEEYLLAQQKVKNYGELKNIFRPYYIKSNLLAFSSSAHQTLNTALALFTALNLAEQGLKVGLIETISEVPLLASCLSVEHPYLNTAHALAMYTNGNKAFLKNCLNQAEKHLNDPYALGPLEHLKYLPSTFYFLPDGISNQGRVEKETWSAFLQDLTRCLIFEQNFQFIIFLANGEHFFNQVVLEKFSYLKFRLIDPLPASVFWALQRRKKLGEQIICTRSTKNLRKELRCLGEEPFLYPPDDLEGDFLHYVYEHQYRKISTATQNFINKFLVLCGVKVNLLENEKKWWSKDIFQFWRKGEKKCFLKKENTLESRVEP